MTEFERHPQLRRAFYINLITGVYHVVLVVIMLASLVLILRSLQAGEQSRDRLLDCTTPTGTCYQEGQRRTAVYLKTLQMQGVERELITRATVVAAVACAKVHDDIVDIQECVDKELNNE